MRSPERTLHQPILDRVLWDRVQQQLCAHAVRRRARATRVEPSPLAGKLFDAGGEHLTPSHALKGERRYRYYLSRSLARAGRARYGMAGGCPLRSSGGPWPRPLSNCSVMSR